MNEENRRANIQEELERARQSRQAADVLFEKGLIADAVSRLYYGVLHTVRALLLTKGLEPRSHEGCLALFSLHFVKRGPFEPADGHTFSRLMKYREEADYNPSYTFTKEDYLDFLGQGDTLCGKILGHLEEEDYA